MSIKDGTQELSKRKYKNKTIYKMGKKNVKKYEHIVT